MKWKLFADLAEITGERHISIELEDTSGVTVEDALDTLLTEYPGLRDRVLDGSGDIHRHISVLQNGTDIRNIDGMKTRVEQDDELALLPPVSGGG